MARRNEEAKPTRRPKRRTPPWLRVIGRLTILMAVMMVTFGCGLIAAIPMLHLPDVGGLKATHGQQSTLLLDAKGRRLATLHGEENRQSVPLKDMAPMLPKAVVAMEDARFYQHWGVDPIGLARAAVSTLLFRHTEGGSTLTQQLAKNLYLTPEQTFKRKIADMLLAYQIERHYSKDQILELYLNQIYWGHGAFGCEAASMTYFAKHAHDLNLAECALLAGIVQGPELFTPYRNPKVAKERQKLVLNRMLTLGYITQQQLDEAWQYPVQIHGIQSGYQAPYFTAYVQQMLVDKIGAAALLHGGYKITTSLDLDMQRAAEEAVTRQVARLRSAHVSQGALVCIDPHSGEIKAMVGGLSFADSQFNRAVQAHRQPGSSFKPFVYLTALSSGMTPETKIKDEAVSFPMGDGRTYTPHNDDGRYRGDISLREALWHSVNVVAVKLAAQFGPDRIIQVARSCGISSPMQANLSLALGSSEVTPLELCSAYGTLATGGKYTAPMAILKIVDGEGRVLILNQPETKDVYDPVPIAALTDMMQGVLTRGTGTPAYFGRPAAGKTGTSSDHRDAWFAGFTPDLVSVVWVGNDDNSPMRDIWGANSASIWGQFMKVATRGLPSHGFAAMPAMSDTSATPSDVNGMPLDSLETPSPSPSPSKGAATAKGGPSPAAPSEPQANDDNLQELPPSGDPMTEQPPPN